MTTLRERFDDLLADEDAGMTRLVGELDSLFAFPDVPHRLVRPDAVSARGGGPHPRQWSRLRLTTAAAAAVVVLTGATLAASSLLASTWQRDRGLDHVFQAGMVTNLQLAQTNGGVTVKVERAYADVNRIAVGVSVAAPASLGGQVSVHPQSIELRDLSGWQFPQTMGSAYADGRSPYGAQVIVFDAASLSRDADVLQLDLRIGEVRGQNGAVSGPWRFSFPLRVLPAQLRRGVLETEVGVRADVRLVAAPSETRLYIRAADAHGHPWTATVVRLFVGDHSYMTAWGKCESDGACPLFVFTESLADQGDNWVVRIDGLEMADRSGPSISGPWFLALK